MPQSWRPQVNSPLAEFNCPDVLLHVGTLVSAGFLVCFAKKASRKTDKIRAHGGARVPHSSRSCAPCGSCSGRPAFPRASCICIMRRYCGCWHSFLRNGIRTRPDIHRPKHAWHCSLGTKSMLSTGTCRCSVPCIHASVSILQRSHVG